MTFYSGSMIFIFEKLKISSELVFIACLPLSIFFPIQLFLVQDKLCGGSNKNLKTTISA